jgi:hypothetical protein
VDLSREDEFEELLRRVHVSVRVRLIWITRALRGGVELVVRRPEPSLIVYHRVFSVARLAEAVVFVSFIKAIDEDNSHTFEVLCSALNLVIDLPCLVVELLAEICGKLRFAKGPVAPGELVASRFLLVEKLNVAWNIDLECFSWGGTSRFSTSVDYLVQSVINLVANTAIIDFFLEVREGILAVFWQPSSINTVVEDAVTTTIISTL